MTEKKLWPESHPDVIRTCLPYEPHHLGVRVIESASEFREAMTYENGAPVSEEEQAEVDRIAASFDEGYRVLMLEAYPEAYRLLLGSLRTSYAAMVPYVQQQRRKRAREN